MAGLRFVYPAADSAPPDTPQPLPASGAPDLVVSALSAPGSAAAGAAVAIADTTCNQGDAGAGASTTRFVLSRDASPDAADVVLGQRRRRVTGGWRRQPRIDQRDAAGHDRPGHVPPAGSGRCPCVVAEGSETNNVASLTLTVVADGPATELIVDNAPAGIRDTAGGRSFSGRWCASSAPSPFGGGSLASCGFFRDTYRWTPRLPASGTYDVYVWWTSSPSRSRRVPITISHAAGRTTRTFDQRTGGGRWQLHGRYTFAAGTAGSVSVSDGNGQAAADAVRFVRVP